MSRFLSERHAALTPYTPGEQPKEIKYIKLNTNESPYPPSDKVVAAARDSARHLNLYSDPQLSELRRAASIKWDLDENMLLMTNGSDEILSFAFSAFGDDKHPFAFPSLTYGFYPVFADLYHIPYKKIPLREDLSVNPDDYKSLGANIVIANPNAPTGMYLNPDEITKIIVSNPDNIVVIDEAYIDFGGESVLPLVKKYSNLIVTRTFSKSYSLAGARLGFGAASPDLIRDMNTIKYSLNPYNVNRMTSACGVAAIEDSDYYMDNCQKIIGTREWTKEKLSKLGFTLTDSMANFLFAKNDTLGGENYYKELRSRGILVRYFGGETKDWVRITIGSREEMEVLIDATSDILAESNI